MKRIIVVAAAMAIFVALADDVEIVKVKGQGVGADKTEALKDAYRDAVERAVGLYVDAEQMMKNEKLVTDRILTQSNAYIEKYNIVVEAKKPNGLVAITILANVRKRDLAKKINDVMPSQSKDVAAENQNLHAQIVTDFKANEDALSIVKNEFKDFSPVKQLMKASLGSIKPIVEKIDEDPSLVRLWYPIKIEVDKDKYYKEFAPRWSLILDQIKTSPTKRLDLRNNLKYVKAYNNSINKKFGMTRKNRSGIMTRCDEKRDLDYVTGGDDLMEWGVALNEEYHGVMFFDTQVYGKQYLLSGLEERACLVFDFDGPGDFGGVIRRYHKYNKYSHDYDYAITEDCSFIIGLVTAEKGTTLSGRLYKIPYECVKEIVAWQKRLVGEGKDNNWYRDAATTSFELNFTDASGEEVAGGSFMVRNYDVLNFGCVLLEDPDHHGNGGKRLLLITPLVGGFAKSYVKWISVDVPKDDVAKIATAIVSVEE